MLMMISHLRDEGIGSREGHWSQAGLFSEAFEGRG